MATNTDRALNMKDEVTFMTTELFDEVLSSDNLRWAWQRVKANKGAPGIDGVTIAEFPAYARTYWPAIKEQLKDGRYQPQPMRRVEIPKPGGGNAPSDSQGTS